MHKYVRQRHGKGEKRGAVSELSALRPSTLSTTQSSDGTRLTAAAADRGVYVCVCVCVYERERERERECTAKKEVFFFFLKF